MGCFRWFVSTLVAVVFVTAVLAEESGNRLYGKPSGTWEFNNPVIPAKVTATGSTLFIGNQVLYFEGLDKEEVSWIYKSLLGGGTSAILRNLAHYGYYAAAVPYFGGSGLELLSASLRLSGASLYYYFTLSNIWRILDARAWYALPSAVNALNLYPLFKLVGIPIKEHHLYLVAAALKGAGALGGAVDQYFSKTNIQYQHVPLSGAPGKQFMVKAIFPEDGSLSPLYEMNRIAIEEPEGKEGYDKLSHVLAGLNIDRIYIVPDKSGSNTLTTFFYDHFKERNIKLAINGEFGSHAHSPWLLNAIHLKQDRQAIHSARSALSPRVMGVIAEAYNTYANAEQCSANHESGCQRINQINGNYYLYTPDLLDPGAVNQVQHDGGGTDFVLDADENRRATFQWSNGIFWPGLSLTVHDKDASLVQWWFPEWFSRFLTVEMASRGRDLASSAVDRGVQYISKSTGFDRRIMDTELQRRNELRARLGMDPLPQYTESDYQAMYESPKKDVNRPSRRTWFEEFSRNIVGEFDMADEVELRQELPVFEQAKGGETRDCLVCGMDEGNLKALPGCNSPICPECLLNCGRADAGKSRSFIQLGHWLTGKPENFKIACPVRCGNDVSARVVHWDPQANTPSCHEQYK